MFYTIFGLSLYSSRPLPGLVAGATPSRVDVSIEWAKGPPQASPGSSPAHWFDSPFVIEGVPLLRAWKLETGTARLLFWNDVEFLLDRRAQKVRVHRPPDVSFEDAVSLLFDDILALLLRWRGLTCLHASAVRVDGRAVAFVGDVGSGKSTTAGALVEMGHPLITDDLLPLLRKEGRFFVQPAYPRLRLWPESATALGHDERRLPRLAPGRAKRRLDLAGKEHAFQQRPLPLAAVYLFGARTEDDAAPYVEAVSMQASVVALLANKYTKYLLDKEMAAADFDILAQLAAQIRPRRLVPHADLARLPQMCRLLLADLAP